MTETVKRYHSGAMLLHWLTALLLMGNLVLGLLLEDIPSDQKFQFYQLHKSLGISVLVLTLLRIVWRFMFPVPALSPTLKAWEKGAVKITHVLFYVLMLGLPLSGWALVSASTRKIPTVLFGLIPLPNMPFFESILDVGERKAIASSIEDVHGLLSYVMIGLLAVHILAALRHHWMLKDETILRMTPKCLDGLLDKLRGK
jgi:cytochrome b561